MVRFYKYFPFIINSLMFEIKYLDKKLLSNFYTTTNITLRVLNFEHGINRTV